MRFENAILSMRNSTALSIALTLIGLVSIGNPHNLTVSVPIIPSAVQGIPYDSGNGGNSAPGGAVLNIAGGASPYTCKIVAGSLPKGLTISEVRPVSTPEGLCVLTGTPTMAGDFPFTIQVRDSASGIATQKVLLVVQTATPPAISNVVATPTSATTETITWTTNVPASSQVIWGIYGNYTNITPESDTAGVTSHSVAIQVSSRFSYGYGVISRGVSGGAPKDYLVANAGFFEKNFVAGSPSLTGTFDFGVSGVGPHNVIQGFPLYVLLNSWQISGTAHYPGNFNIQITGIPPNAQVHWPDVQDNGCNLCGTVSTHKTRDDTFNPNNGPGVAAQFEILTNVGGTTPAGAYTLNVTASTNGNPAHSFTWPINVSVASFPFASPADYPAIPKLSLWQTNMTTFAAKWVGTAEPGCTECVAFYDGAWVYEQIANFTGKPAVWLPISSAINVVYRDHYVLPNNGAVPGYQVFPHGLYYDCTVRKTFHSCMGLHELATKAPGAQMLANSSGYPDAIFIREGCYMLGAKRLDYDAGGGTTLASVKQMAAYCLGYEDMIVNGYTNFEQPFMDGLMGQALIEYYLDPKTGNGDSRVPPAIKAIADWMWTNEWLPWSGTTGMFAYNNLLLRSNCCVNSKNRSVASDLSSLNLLIAPIYAWLYQQTGQKQYQLEGDTIWNAGVTGPPGSGIGWSGKNFSQQYRWSFDYVKWRTAH
jgi:hypothetical protein